MNKPTMNDECKEDHLTLSAAKPTLRFTSINSINRKLTEPENVLKFAHDTIKCILKESDLFDNAFKYSFDIFALTKHTRRPLLILGIYLLSNSPIFEALFEENKVKLLHCAHFLDLCEKLYQTNAYHNDIHAADVMQFNMILLSSSYIQEHLTDYECLAAFMAAVAHDCGHIGKNNDFLVKSKHDLAIKFNNVSCLEYYHIAQFQQTITEHSKGNWIKLFNPKTQQYVIDIVEYAILGTDMGVYHNEIKKELKEKYTKQFVDKCSEKGLTFEEKKFIIRAMLHLSDISNPMRMFDVAQKWANRVNEEFFDQGDVMKEMGLEISMGCDRNKTDVVKNQNGFVEFCVKPLTVSLSVMIDELKWCLHNVQVNAVKWNEWQEQRDLDENEDNNTNDSPSDDSKLVFIDVASYE